MGGKCDPRQGPPLITQVNVRSLHPGRFDEPAVRHSALKHYDMGPTAIVETDDGVTIQLTSRPVPPFSLNQLTSCGLDPSAFHVIVAKGVHAPVAAYAPVCASIIRVNTPGVTTADVERLPFQYRRRPMHPFERDTPWAPPEQGAG
jgi:microcystin degradation protein MlrC